MTKAKVQKVRTLSWAKLDTKKVAGIISLLVIADHLQFLLPAGVAWLSVTKGDWPSALR